MEAGERQKIVVILGTNASGKSSLGLELAKMFHGEIISADSRQVYKGFDLCSGKVSGDELAAVPHHLISLNAIDDPFSMADFQKNAYDLIPRIYDRGHIPFIVGGTGLYIDSVVKGYLLTESQPDPESRKLLSDKSLQELHDELSGMGCHELNNSEYNNKRRLIRLIEKARRDEPLENVYAPKYQPLLLGVSWSREILHNRIDERLTDRLKAGMIDEVDSYLKSGGHAECLTGLGLEYKYICWYLTGKTGSYDLFYHELSRAIKKFAKRQLTWFRKNNDIIWLDTNGDYVSQAKELTAAFISR